MLTNPKSLNKTGSYFFFLVEFKNILTKVMQQKVLTILRRICSKIDCTLKLQLIFKITVMCLSVKLKLNLEYFWEVVIFSTIFAYKSEIDHFLWFKKIQITNSKFKFNSDVNNTIQGLDFQRKFELNVILHENKMIDSKPGLFTTSV